MKFRKFEKKKYINIIFSYFCLILFIYIFLFSDKFQIDEDFTFVNANFLEIKERKSSYIPLDEIIIWDNEFEKFTYIVQKWDTLSQIAFNFWTTVSTLKTVNKLSSDTLKPWQELVISYEEWVIYEIQTPIKLIDFTKKYWIDLEKTKQLNYFSDDDVYLEKDDEIFIPISVEEAKKLWLTLNEDLITKPTTTTNKNTKTTPKKQTIQTNEVQIKWNSIISKYYYRPSISNWFVAWHCTWFVAIKKFPYSSDKKQKRLWGGHAKYWYKNAKDAWYSVWSEPKEWAIVVIKNWWARYYSLWHVWIVVEIDKEKNKILIEEMNALWRFVVTKRWINMDSKITWYIYL